jgi:Flp pilus assembly protein TadD
VATANKKVAAATKRLTVARASLQRATALDSTCADCWGLLGYACSQTGDRAAAFDAYARCLKLKPEHFTAREYQAEAYLMDGRIRDARSELEWLKTKGNMTTLETRNLTAAIERWEQENPGAKEPAEPAR